MYCKSRRRIARRTLLAYVVGSDATRATQSTKYGVSFPREPELTAQLSEARSGAEDAHTVAARLAAIIDSSDDAIVSKNLQGIIMSWNPAAERMFGYSAAEAVGRSIRIIIPADRQSEEDEVLRRIGIGERVDHFETVRQRRDGSMLDISLTVSPIRNREGVVVGASKIARDITERKRAEAILRESIAIKNQFLSLVSHELRTPIAVIVGNGHLLLRRGDAIDAEDRRQALTDLTFEAERLQRIIENLLILTRAEAQKDFELEFVKLERLTEAAVNAFHRRKPSREVNFHGDGLAPTVVGESTITTMVLENLLSNADKYSAPHEPIDVVLETGDDRVTVHVLDRGIGLTETDMQSIFDPFYRSAEARQRAGGMGLGLAVCRKIIEVQGGSISGSPRPGGGADFSFSLPIAVEPEE